MGIMMRQQGSGGRERRAFGRRRTLLHALVHTRGRPPTPCIVRNVSEGGALLEFPSDPYWLPSYFTLTIDSDGFSAQCEIRHKSQHGAGVFFQSVAVRPGGVDTRYALQDKATVAATRDPRRSIASGHRHCLQRLPRIRITSRIAAARAWGCVPT